MTDVVYFEPYKLPEGRVAVHNHVRFSGAVGLNGWRAWHQPPDDRLVRCDCPAFPEFEEHFRVAP